MTDFANPGVAPVPMEVGVLLLAQWAQHLAQDRLGLSPAGSGQGPGAARTFGFGDSTQVHFALRYTPDRNAWAVDQLKGVSEADASAIRKDAAAHAAALEFGPDVAFRAILSTREPDPFGGGFLLHFMRLLADQIRIDGRRRLADRVVLEFVEEGPAEGPAQLFAPKTQITSRGDSFDNALAESFLATLEGELLDRQIFSSRPLARMAVFDFIEACYNQSRRHSSLGYLSPADFERRWAASEGVSA